MLDYSNNKRKVFASYHFTSMDAKFNGFGNYVGMFDTESYAENIEKFIEDLEKCIENSLNEKLGIGVKVKVMWFR